METLIDHPQIREHLVKQYQHHLEQTLDLAKNLDIAACLLSSRKVWILCRYFEVDTIDEVFEAIDVINQT